MGCLFNYHGPPFSDRLRYQVTSGTRSLGTGSIDGPPRPRTHHPAGMMVLGGLRIMGGLLSRPGQLS